MSTKALSSKQQRVLDFIIDYITDNGYPPSVRDICDGLGLRSTSTVHGYLERLENRGHIRRDPSRPRAIEVIDHAEKMRDIVSLPIVGSVAAGKPILATEIYEDTLHLPSSFFRCEEGEAFILTVKGDSMMDIGMLSGDSVVVRRSTTAVNGEIIVALVEEEATVKRFYKEDGYYRLQPENTSMDPILVNECQVLGKVIGLLRQY